MKTPETVLERAPSGLSLRRVAELTRYPQNARTHSEDQVEQLARSIDEFGLVGGIVVRNGVIAKGHGTLSAVSRLLEGGAAVYPAPGRLSDLDTRPEPFPAGFVPVIDASGWSDAQFRAYVLADNQLALNAGWDEDVLRSELLALGDLQVDLGMLGFSGDELADLFETKASPWKTGPDEVPPVRTAVSKAGDVWILGAHRVICGDSRDAPTLARLMDGLEADACWTDPPYNVDYSAKAGKIANDSMKDGAFRVFLIDAFQSLFAVLKRGASIYVAHADTEGLNFRAAFQAAGFKTSGCLIWAKDSLVLGRSDYQWQHEPILYGWKPGAPHRWFGGRKQTTLRQLEGSAFLHNDDGSVTVTIGLESLTISGKDLVATVAESSLIRFEKPHRSAEHPTMKPVELVSRMLRNSTKTGDLVVDSFGGSGSTLIACEMLGRAARLVELEPRFVDVIVTRWQNFTGRAARGPDGRPFPVAPEVSAR